MDAWYVAIGVGLLLILVVFLLARANASLRAKLRVLDSAKRSQSTRYGQITEQFAPFMDSWPWDSKRFKFLGDPIDGIQFTDEGVVLIEIKSNKSRLSAVQRQVRDHVEAGRVFWREVRID